MAYTVLWIMLTSQLGTYSKVFGPQVLLQLNLAYYLPSIPVLVLSGQVRRAPDGQHSGGCAGRMGCAPARLRPLIPG